MEDVDIHICKIRIKLHKNKKKRKKKRKEKKEKWKEKKYIDRRYILFFDIFNMNKNNDNMKNYSITYQW